MRIYGIQIDMNAVGKEQAAMDVQRQMMSVVHRMREIPELPSEKPKDISYLTEVQFPDEGGVLTHMSDHEEPYRGFPFYEMVEKIDTIKKIIRSTLSSFFHSTKRRNKLQLLLVVFVPWLVGDAARAAIYTFYRIVERFRIKKEMYSQAMRALYQAFDTDDEVLLQVRDLLCMVLEFDNAYRFRLQDIIAELDKATLQKKPVYELRRLLTIMQMREKEQTVKDTWELFKWVLPIVFFVNRRLKKQVIAVLSNIDVGRIALTKEDKWYCYPRKDYTFGFQLHPTDDDKLLIERVKKNMERIEAKTSVREESTKAHEELFAKHKLALSVDADTDKKIHDGIVQAENELRSELEVKLQIARKAVLGKHLTSEQLALLAKQDEEIREMNEHYDKKLQHVS